MYSSLSCLHVVATLHPAAGGPSRTVVHLVDALADRGDVQIMLLTQCFGRDPAVQSQSAAVVRRVCESTSRPALAFGLPLRAGIDRIVKHELPNLIHSHGLWLPVNHWTARAARKLDVPLIIHPRGMLEPWALNHKSLKKKLAMTLFQRRDLERARVLVATSHGECDNIRKLGFRQPVALIPNGVEFSSTSEPTSGARSEGDVRTALFLSRVHQIKGLINLVRAWGRLQPKGWRLQIAGPNEGGHLGEVMAEARRLGVEASIDYIGEVDGERKAAVYQAADIFVLPTFSENFGVVVAEALSHGLPVITTRGAPWEDLNTYGCGWWIDIGVEPLVDALRQAFGLPDAERRAMGERGRVYVQRYNWADIARQTADMYRWVLGQGPRPDCVQLA